MKKIILLILCFCCNSMYSQVNPTLGIGLETLTLNKGTIDVEVLTQIILKKQKELKNEALKRFMLKMFPDTNYTTRFYVQNCLNILLNEKNPQVIEKEILELTTNYAIALGVTKAITEMDKDKAIFKSDIPKSKKQNDYQKLFKELKNDSEISKLDSQLVLKNEENEKLEILYTNFNNIDHKIKALKSDIEKVDRKTIIDNYNTIYEEIENCVFNNETFKTGLKKKHKLLKLNIDPKNYDKDLIIDNLNKIESNYKKYTKKRIKNFECIEKKLKRRQRILMRNNVEYNIKNNEIENNINLDELNFGDKLDIVSLALSDNDLLRKKGFFKNKIDYTEVQNYFYSKSKDKEIIDIINNKINPYIENYDIIKNIIIDFDLSTELKAKNINIINKLTSLYFKQLDVDGDFKVLIKDKALSLNFKNEIENFNKFLDLKYNIEKLETFKGISLLTSNETIIEINKLEENVSSENLNENLKSLESLESDLDKYKKQYDSIISTNNFIVGLNEILSLINKDEFGKKLIKINDITISKLNRNDNIDISINRIRKLNKNLLEESTNDSITYKINSINKEIEILNGYIPNKNLKNKNNLKYILTESEKDSLISKIAKLNYTDNYTQIDKEIEKYQEKIANQTIFFEVYLKSLLGKLDTLSIKPSIDNEKEKNHNLELSKLISKIYERLIFFKTNKNYTISDINYLEKELLPELVGLKFVDIKENQQSYTDLIKGLKNLSPLLKIRLLSIKTLNLDLTNVNDLLSLFEFIGNLDKLDKAQTYASIVDLIKKNSEEITKVLPDGEFKDGYNLFINGIKKYTLINPNAEKEYVEIDVVSFLDDLQQHYERNNPSNFSLYLTLGLNQNMFFNKYRFRDTNETLSSVGFASEKIGLKWKIHDFKRYRGYENAIKNDIYLNKRAPFINEFYTTLYGSGLLYSLANTTTNQNFNFPHAGIAFGLRFYNALDFNLMFGFPIIKDQKFFNNGFIGVGFDIPLGEYLEALGNK